MTILAEGEYRLRIQAEGEPPRDIPFDVPAPAEGDDEIARFVFPLR